MDESEINIYKRIAYSRGVHFHRVYDIKYKCTRCDRIWSEYKNSSQIEEIIPCKFGCSNSFWLLVFMRILENIFSGKWKILVGWGYLIDRKLVDEDTTPQK